MHGVKEVGEVGRPLIAQALGLLDAAFLPRFHGKHNGNTLSGFVLLRQVFQRATEDCLRLFIVGDDDDMLYVIPCQRVVTSVFLVLRVPVYLFPFSDISLPVYVGNARKQNTYR